MSEDDNGRLEDANARLGEAITGAAEAVARSLGSLTGCVIAALRVLAADPVVRFAMEHPELLRAERPKPCWCLCAKAHPGLAVCDGEGVATGTVTLEGYGPVTVQYCAACAAAQASRRFRS